MTSELPAATRTDPFAPIQGDEPDAFLVAISRTADDGPLRIDPEGFAALRERLRDANASNPRFGRQFDRLTEVLQVVLRRLASRFEDRVERVVAAGDWATFGIDLRELPTAEIVLLIVVRATERPLALYLEIADQVFGDLEDDDILVQFQLATVPEWQRAVESARLRGESAALGIQLLRRG